MDLNGPEWTEMDLNGPEWTEMDLNGLMDDHPRLIVH